MTCNAPAICLLKIGYVKKNYVSLLNFSIYLCIGIKLIY